MSRALLIALVCAASLAYGRGQIRFAVVVGANIGDPEETPLEFAEDDATQLADALTRFGSVPEENLVLLRGRSAQRLTDVLSTFRGRIREAVASGGEVVLFVSYSGHADARALHLGAERFEFSVLEAAVADTGAQLIVMVIDACRSGSLTRIKGGAPAAPFEIKVDDRLDSEGMAIITSAAAGEDAQESSRLRGGIFSHHFVVGLLGAADVSKDQNVTLSEAYRYAYQETLRTTSRAPVVQHPTYSFQMRGREDLVVTRLIDHAGMGRVRLVDAGEWMLLPQDHGTVIELSTKGGTEVRVRPGRYTVRRRADGRVAEIQTRIKGQDATVIQASELAPVPYGASLRRGLNGRSRSVWAITTGAEITSPRDGRGPGIRGGVGARLDLRSITWELQLSYGEERSKNESLRLRQQIIGANLGARKMFDLGSLALGAGLRVGLDGVRQSFQTRGTAPTRNTLLSRAGPTAHIEYAVAPWLTLALRGGLDALLRPGGQLDAISDAGLEVVFHVAP